MTKRLHYRQLKMTPCGQSSPNGCQPRWKAIFVVCPCVAVKSASPSVFLYSRVASFREVLPVPISGPVNFEEDVTNGYIDLSALLSKTRQKIRGESSSPVLIWYWDKPGFVPHFNQRIIWLQLISIEITLDISHSQLPPWNYSSIYTSYKICPELLLPIIKSYGTI